MKPPARLGARPAPPIKRVRLRSPRFLLRTVTGADASEGWCDWFSDPDVMEPLNLPTRPMTLADLRQFIAGHDQERRLLIGIFEAETLAQIGAYMIEIDHAHRTATLNVLIGDKAWWGKKVINETRAALLDFLFDVVKVEKAIGMPVTRNFPAVFNYKAQGWRLEGTLMAHARALHAPGPRLDQYVFALSPADWRARRERQGLS